VTPLLTVSLIALMSVSAGDLEWKDLGNGRLQLLDHGKPAFVYNYGSQLAAGAPEDRRRSSYVYPLYTPAGVNVTDDFPKDHYHHRGLFWAWPLVEFGGRKYDLWMMRGGIDTRFERFLRRAATTDRATLEVENGWYADGVRIVRETLLIQTRPAKGNARVLEVGLTLEPLKGPVVIKGSQEKGKSYGGLSVRFAPREQTRIVTSESSGPIAKDEDLVNHNWAELDAVFAGKKRASLRIEAGPQHPGGPPQWCLRGYGFIGAAFPGQTGTTLEQGRSIHLSYTVTLKDLE
jgi:hypothetical protein